MAATDLSVKTEPAEVVVAAAAVVIKVPMHGVAEAVVVEAVERVRPSPAQAAMAVVRPSVFISGRRVRFC
jgi:hypothetical protein